MVYPHTEWHIMTQACANELGRTLTADDVGKQVARVRIYANYDHSFYFFQDTDSPILREVTKKDLRVALISPLGEMKLNGWNDTGWATVEEIKNFMISLGWIFCPVPN